jgi:hypothetical protein
MIVYAPALLLLVWAAVIGATAEDAALTVVFLAAEAVAVAVAVRELAGRYTRD